MYKLKNKDPRKEVKIQFNKSFVMGDNPTIIFFLSA